MICRICNSSDGLMMYTGRCRPCFGDGSGIDEADWDSTLRQLGMVFWDRIARSVVVDSRMAATEGANMGDA